MRLYTPTGSIQGRFTYIHVPQESTKCKQIYHTRIIMDPMGSFQKHNREIVVQVWWMPTPGTPMSLTVCVCFRRCVNENWNPPWPLTASWWSASGVVLSDGLEYQWRWLGLVLVVLAGRCHRVMMMVVDLRLICFKFFRDLIVAADVVFDLNL